MESSSEDSSRDSDCTNPDDDSIFRPRRSARLAKTLKNDYDTAPYCHTDSRKELSQVSAIFQAPSHPKLLKLRLKPLTPRCTNVESSISLNLLGNYKNTLRRHVTDYYRVVRHSPFLAYVM